MTTYTQKIVSGVVTASLFASSIAPLALADTTVTVQGNGSNSSQNVGVKTSNETIVEQANVFVVENTIKNKASTGSNKANGNTSSGDGSVSVSSGDATAQTAVTVHGPTNEASIEGCECSGDTDVTVKDNGTQSKTKVKVKTKNVKAVGQYNDVEVKNKVKNKAKTGKNKTNDNTGTGSVENTSGDADATTEVEVSAPGNTLNI